LLSFFTVASCVTAGEFNLVLNIGDTAPVWSDLEGVDGKRHGSDEFASDSFIVVVFTCNSCPYATDSEARLNALSVKAKQLGGGLVAINVNLNKEDLLPAMKSRAEAIGFDFPYLHDPTQEIAKRFGARTTPEFFVLDGERRIVYMGSLDDSPDGKSVTKEFVEMAIADVIEGRKSELSETVPIGCRIRFPRVRK